MSILIFLVDKEYDQEGLDEHLYYLQTQGGTPDFWDSVDSLRELVKWVNEYNGNSGEVVYYDNDTETEINLD